MKLALLAALVIATPLSAQTPTKVNIPGNVTLRLEQGAAPYMSIALKLRCDVYSGSTVLTSLGCTWVSRDPGLVQVTTPGRWTIIQPARKAGETWVIASYPNVKRDSIKIKVALP